MFQYSTDRVERHKAKKRSELRDKINDFLESKNLPPLKQ